MTGRSHEAHPPRAGSSEGPGSRPPRRPRIGLAGWVVPGATLALLPKCPACLAAYVALGTGFALPHSVAAGLRSAMIALSVGWLGFQGARLFRGSGGLAPRVRGRVGPRVNPARSGRCRSCR